MKKAFLSLALAAVLGLTACGKAVPDDKPTEIHVISKNHDYYENGVVIGDKLSEFLDFETMIKAPLCASPNCTHTTYACLAKNVGIMPVFYNKYIYYFESNEGNVRETPEGKEFYIESRMKKASLASSEIQNVCEFDDCVPNINYESYVLYNNLLYFIGDDRNPKKDAYGGYSYGNVGGAFFLCSIDLDTGEYINYGSVYEGYKQYEGASVSYRCKINGVYHGKMYMQCSFVKEYASPDDKDTEWTRVVFEFDFDSKTWKECDMPASRYMTNEVYTYYDENNKALNLITDTGTKTVSLKNENIIGEPVVMSIYNNKLFLSDLGKWFDLSDMSIHSMEDYKFYWVVGYYEGNYILVQNEDHLKLTEDELLALGE